MKQRSTIYLDFAATTPVDQRVLEAMFPYFSERFGNPASIHRAGREARQAVDNARQQLARILQAHPGEIYFTAGGSEANNIVIQGIARVNQHKGTHLVTSAMEHPSVLQTFRLLEKQGFNVTYLYPNADGLITPEKLESALTPSTTLVSIMMVNNEIGTIQPIEALCHVAHQRGVIFHTDAVQGFGKLPISVRQREVDALSFSGHKIYGPKGIGGFYLRKGTPIQAIMAGGGQEQGLRPGTLNVPGIVGLAAAAQLMATIQEAEYQRLQELAQFFIDLVKTRIPEVQINGQREVCSPYIINLSFPGIDNQALQMFLDMEGIAVSTGSACHSGTIEPSHVLKALRYNEDRIQSALRFSLGKSTTREQLEHVIAVLQKAVNQLR